jgi:ABC-type Co2+ transport system permease subunit
MSSARAAGARSPGKTIAVAILAIIGILAIAAGILYFVEPAKSLPSILGTITHPASRAAAHRSLRGAVALVVGVVLLVGAWLVGRSGSSARHR